jgi:hypothetical protein
VTAQYKWLTPVPMLLERAFGKAGVNRMAAGDQWISSRGLPTLWPV